MKILKNAQVKPTVSLEAYMTSLESLSVVSTESISSAIGSFFQKMYDGSRQIMSRATDFKSERDYDEAVKDKFTVLRECQTLSNADLANLTITIPDRFSGSLVDLIDSITFAHKEIYNQTLSGLESLSIDVAANINSGTGGFEQPRSTPIIRKSKKTRDALLAKVSRQFTYKQARNTGMILDVLRSTKDIRDMYVSLAVMKDTFHDLPLEAITNKIDEIHSLVDTLVDTIKSKGEEVRNTSALRDLTESIHESAANVEFLGYLQGLALQVYSAVGSIGTAIVNKA